MWPTGPGARVVKKNVWIQPNCLSPLVCIRVFLYLGLIFTTSTLVIFSFTYALTQTNISTWNYLHTKLPSFKLIMQSYMIFTYRKVVRSTLSIIPRDGPTISFWGSVFINSLLPMLRYMSQNVLCLISTQKRRWCSYLSSRQHTMILPPRWHQIWCHLYLTLELAFP